MASTLNKVSVPGIWGPYYSSMFTDCWLLEGGQSATGALLDHLIQTHPAYSELEKKELSSNRSVFEELNVHLEHLKESRNLTHIDFLTRDFHILPDFHGNRSPIGDPNLTGMISGLHLESSLDDLSILYLSGVQALAYGTRHILSSMAQKSVDIQCIIACGGLARNSLFIHQHAEILQLPICIPQLIAEAVPLGAAITASCAFGYFQNLHQAGLKMSRIASTVFPNEELKEYHARKYKVFLKMYQDQFEYKQIIIKNLKNIRYRKF
jgi:FGGY-family pentulose kinase